MPCAIEVKHVLLWVWLVAYISFSLHFDLTWHNLISQHKHVPVSWCLFVLHTQASHIWYHMFQLMSHVSNRGVKDNNILFCLLSACANMHCLIWRPNPIYSPRPKILDLITFKFCPQIVIILASQCTFPFFQYTFFLFSIHLYLYF